MIALSVTRGGILVLRSKRGRDRRALRDLDYLRWRDNMAVALWTYLPDLHRDLPPGSLKPAPGFTAAVRAVMARVRARTKGDDQEVCATFPKDRQPYPFQIEGIHAGVNSRGSLLLADDTGLGKTPQATGIMNVLRARGVVDRVVLVVPHGLKHQWYDEVQGFTRDHEALGSIVVVSGTPVQRRGSYASPWDILILNPDLIRRDFETLRKLERVDLVVLDEASCIRNPETDTAKMMKRLWPGSGRLALTATPVENKLVDLRSVAEWVRPGVFPSQEYFDYRYVDWRRIRIRIKSKYGGTFTIPKLIPRRYKNLGEVRSKLNPIYIRRRVREVDLELPRLIVKWEMVELPPKQRRIYEACKADVMEEIVGMRGAALQVPLQGLRQACNSTALVTEGDKKPAQIKVDRLLDLLESDLAGEQVIVFTEYERFATLILKVLKKREISAVGYTGKMTKGAKLASLASFKAGDKRVLVATKSGERGHNLQCAGLVVNMDLPWNPASLKQRIGRALRLHSEHEVVRVLNMIARRTIEETLILRRIYAKRKLFEDLLGGDELTEADPIGRMDGAAIRRYL